MTKSKLTLLATIRLPSAGIRLTAASVEEYRAQLEQRLHSHLDELFIVPRKRDTVFVFFSGKMSAKEKRMKALGVKRVWEWEAA